MAIEISPDYVRRIAEIARELGIDPRYAERRRLSLQPERADLVFVGDNPEGAEIRLARPAAEAWGALRAAASANGIALLPISGFRSVERQREIIREKLAGGEAIDEILRKVAAPGYSEHHTGCALDIGAPDEPTLEEGFAETAAFAWMKSKAAEFGFRLSYPHENPHGFVFEPWHWFYLERQPRRL